MPTKTVDLSEFTAEVEAATEAKMAARAALREARGLHTHTTEIVREREQAFMRAVEAESAAEARLDRMRRLAGLRPLNDYRLGCG